MALPPRAGVQRTDFRTFAHFPSAAIHRKILKFGPNLEVRGRGDPKRRNDLLLESRRKKSRQKLPKTSPPVRNETYRIAKPSEFGVSQWRPTGADRRPRFAMRVFAITLEKRP
ncbi:hypothetical protein KM043_005110 [Ampulex compressa]|nr:hypothetical protein KM043_005110 [Ampulex compressa]